MLMLSTLFPHVSTLIVKKLGGIFLTSKINYAIELMFFEGLKYVKLWVVFFLKFYLVLYLKICLVLLLILMSWKGNQGTGS